MTTNNIIKLLSEFVPFEVTDPENDNESFLYEAMDSLKDNPDYENAIESIFLLMEKWPHADFGTPGPLVHTLEKFRGKYERYLFESLNRKPIPLTVWMLNRMINGENDEKAKSDLIYVMQSLVGNPTVDNETKKVLQSFIKFQS
ncbi:hypothetical protein SAMN05428988_1182 [Chitinophaga sp. YR573]|uniref:hypothetical protein n=1 Tax=Chitinophaga sp. YR573 TaxID=1881040 RepID=UPI0008B2D9EB|nr:hypothetical protein [Chitinophaga sp. YR573]SEW00551.1 hypothetical protein SAMN05428988_1182 [Chitinophaga sp. YR573]